MDGQPELKAIELFAGGGSVHLALSRVGVSVAYANDFDPAKRAAYTANFPDTRLDGRSIEDVQAHELPPADILHASSPCQDHSGQGEQAGFEHGERGRMAFHAMRLLRGMSTLNRSPKVVVFENVCGLLHRKMLGDFALLLGGLVSEGYAVGAFVMNARAFLPQNRPRVFIVAARHDMAIPPSLVARGPSSDWHPETLRRAHQAMPSQVRKAWRWWKLPPPSQPVPALADLLERDPAGAKWLAEPRLAQLAACMHASDLKEIEEARQNGPWAGVTMQKAPRTDKGETRPRQQVAFDGYARCLLASGGHEAQRVIVPATDVVGFRMRDFTPRERARLTGLPDTYVMPKAATAARQLAGDAVVVPVYEHLARHLLVPLALSEARAAAVEFRTPQRRRKDVTVGGSTANRPSKRATVCLDIRLVPAAREVLGAIAALDGAPVSEFLLRAVDRLRAERGEPPLPRYVPQPRRTASAARRRVATGRGQSSRREAIRTQACHGAAAPPPPPSGGPRRASHN